MLTPQETPRGLLSSVSFWIAATLLLALSVYLAFVPLFDVLGYEFSVALSFLASITAGPVALAFVRYSLMKDQNIYRSFSIAEIYLRAAALNIITLILPLAIILLNALRVKNCNISEGLVYFLALPVLTSLICSGWAVAVGLLVQKKLLGGLVYMLIWILVLIFNLAEFWTGPQMDSFNQLTGWIAGPIYDEVVKPGYPLLFSRLFGLFSSWTLVGLSNLLITRTKFFQKPNLTLQPKWAKVVWVFAVGSVLLWIYKDSLGFGRSHNTIESLLSQTATSEHFMLHVHPNLSEEKVRLLLLDHEFRYHQIEKHLGSLELPIIHSYIFPNPKIKKRLLGALDVQYAKPWSFSLYLHGHTFPHPTLKHELVHVMAADFGSWPVRTSARHVILQNVALLEGLAVAIDWPVRKYDPHIWSAAQKRIDKAPNLVSLFDPLGFWSASARGSYTLSGSFVRFMLDVYGPKLFKKAYQSGRLEGAYSKSPTELISEYESFLDSIDLQPAIIEIAKERFSKPSIFRRTCAHEIAFLRKQAYRSIGCDDTKNATFYLNEALSFFPDDLELLSDLAYLYLNNHQPDQALETLEQLLQRDDLLPAKKARIHGMLADSLVALDMIDQAKGHYLLLQNAHLDDATDRQVAIKLALLSHQDLRKPFMTLIKKTSQPDTASLLLARELMSTKPDFSEGWYLLGRILFFQNQYELAAKYFQKADQQGLENRSIRIENLRSYAQCLYFLGKTKPAFAVLNRLLKKPRHQGDESWAKDWLQRIAFEKQLGNSKSTETKSTSQ